jgi:DoxX-like family
MKDRIRLVAYWFFTAAIAWEMAAGSLWDLLRIDFVREVFDHLGYPYFLLTILGIWKLPCSATLMLPRFPRLKEWAYAGAFFNYTGAAASHLLVGDGPDKWTGPAVLAAITLGSWALRPPNRRLPVEGPPPSRREWIITSALCIVFVVVARLTLPK